MQSQAHRKQVVARGFEQRLQESADAVGFEDPTLPPEDPGGIPVPPHVNANEDMFRESEFTQFFGLRRFYFEMTLVAICEICRHRLSATLMKQLMQSKIIPWDVSMNPPKPFAVVFLFDDQYNDDFGDGNGQMMMPLTMDTAMS